MSRISVEVPAALAGERLDRLVATMAEISRARAAALVDGGEVQVDGAVVTGRAHRVAEGTTVSVTAPTVAPDPAVPEPDPEVRFEVVHADAEVIVVDKPAGVVVHPGAGRSDATLVHGLLARYPELVDVGERDRPGIVHRLDQHTSGLLAVARTTSAYSELVEQLSARTVDRGYRVLVWDEVRSDQGLIDAPLGRSERDRTRVVVAAGGRPARTRYTVESRFRSPAVTSLLTCRLETGRTHQIRAHLASIDHPVVGDGRYGGERSAIPLRRPFLHATRLAFTHPTSGERMRFDSPLPPELSEVLSRLS